MGVPIILASASPRRKELLERLGFTVKVIPPGVDEARIDNENPENYVKRLARAKVLAVVERLSQTLYTDVETGVRRTAPGGARTQDTRWVIGADTVVVLGDQILGKPKDTAEAAEMLHRLSSSSHRVISGFCIHDLRKNKEGVQAVQTEVRFKRLTATEIEKYIAVGESMDKAGAYAVQGRAGMFISEIHGSYSGIMGLPLYETALLLAKFGYRF